MMDNKQQSVDEGEVEAGAVELLPEGRILAMKWLAALSAARIPYRVAYGERGQLRIILTQEWGEAGRREVEEYQRVNRNWPPPAVPSAIIDTKTNLPAAALVAGLLVLAFMVVGAAGEADFGGGRGVVDSVAVLSGEWWRLITGLALHVGVMHLLANLLCLLAFGLALSGEIGFGLAWLGIAVAGGLGNGLAVLLAEQPFAAIGASTAVFAALGMLMVLHLLNRRLPSSQPVGMLSRWHRYWLPVGAALALLAILGTDPDSHLEGHFYGFVAGTLLGLAGHPARRVAGYALLQQVAFAAFMALNALAWQLARGSQ